MEDPVRIGVLGGVASGHGRAAVGLVLTGNADEVGIADGTSVGLVLRPDDPQPAESKAFLDLGFGNAAPARAGEGEVLWPESEIALDKLVAPVELNCHALAGGVFLAEVGQIRMADGVRSDRPAQLTQLADLFPGHVIVRTVVPRQVAVVLAIVWAGVHEKVADVAILGKRVVGLVAHVLYRMVEVDHDRSFRQHAGTLPPSGKLIVGDGRKAHIACHAHQGVEALDREGLLPVVPNAVTHGDGNPHSLSS